MAGAAKRQMKAAGGRIGPQTRQPPPVDPREDAGKIEFLRAAQRKHIAIRIAPDPPVARGVEFDDDGPARQPVSVWPESDK